MATEDHIQESEPDLAQLLVLEAGRILEDLTPERAMSLSPTPYERQSAIEKYCQCLSDAQILLFAAQIVTRCVGRAHQSLR